MLLITDDIDDRWWWWSLADDRWCWWLTILMIDDVDDRWWNQSHTSLHVFFRKLMKKGGVTQLRHTRGCHTVFWKPVQPLQRVPRLACSVASLSCYPGHQLLKCYSLHHNTLAGYLLGKELPSAYTVALSMQHCIPAPEVTAEPGEQVGLWIQLV